MTEVPESAAAEHPRPEGPRETARYWRHPAEQGVELLDARYVHQNFTRHTHPTYVIGVIEAGVEEYSYRGTTQRVGRDGLALVEPDTVHTGHAGAPGGWRYRVMYPAPEVVRRVAREVGLGGLPGFRTSGLHDPALAAHVRRAHQATDQGDRLAASSLLHSAIAHLLRVNAGPARAVDPDAADGPAAVRRAREILQDRLVDPPSLEELAAATGSAPFALHRAFRALHGLPPHAWLNQLRVQRARTLLAAGTPPADVAPAVGFADQPHLGRHFKRHVGVSPAAFQRGLNATYVTHVEGAGAVDPT